MTAGIDRGCDLEVPENRAGALRVAVEEGALGHERESPRLRQNVASHVQSLVTFVTPGRRLRPHHDRCLRRKGGSPVAFGDVWTPFDSRSGHNEKPAFSAGY